MDDGRARESLDETRLAPCKRGDVDPPLQDVAASADGIEASIHDHYGSADPSLVAGFLTPTITRLHVRRGAIGCSPDRDG